jgi:inhibitor of KinA
LTSYAIFPLGDAAVSLDLGPVIDEHHNIRVQAIHDWLQRHPFRGMLDVIVAYSSVSVFYDPAVVRASGVTGGRGTWVWVRDLLEQAWEETEAAGDAGFRVEPARVDGGAEPAAGQLTGRRFRIPVCYEGAYAPDLVNVARQQGLSVKEVIGLHSAVIYRVYMIGFLPGFPYLGTVDQRLEVPRKTRPVPVAAGGVGVAGRQTGIYPLNSPGGWSIIGRTPMRLFDPAADPPVRLQTGDRVEFYPISTEEFHEVMGLSQ